MQKNEIKSYQHLNKIPEKNGAFLLVELYSHDQIWQQ